MIAYKYSLIEDLRWSYRTLSNLKWLKQKKLVVFYPNIFRMLLLWFKRPKIELFSDRDIICYWVHCGTWGAFTPPNKIFICPWEIENAGGFNKVIDHEIKHLIYYEETKHLEHEEREKIINSK
ncbi:MAG: hypothetical protein V1846_04540 [Candidatus Komeilibacteria bacterium]